MGLRLRETILACTLAGVLSVSLVGGALADRDEGSGHGHRTATVVSHGPSNHSNVKPHGKSGSNEGDDNEDGNVSANVSTPTATATPDSQASPVAEATCENHGQVVSAVAHSAPKGPEHGEEVSEVASSDTCSGVVENDPDDTMTVTVTPVASGTVTDTPTATATPNESETATATPDESETATATPTDTATPTVTVTGTPPTATSTATDTATPAASATATSGTTTSSNSNNTVVIDFGKVIHSILNIFASL